MKYFITFCTIALFSSTLFGQTSMVVNTPRKGWTYYDNNSKEINSLNKIPLAIITAVDSVLSKRLGEFKSKVSFSHGQIINIKKVLSEDGPYGYEWVIPKYDLCFNLQDTSFGINYYALNIRLDQYGQILDVNWPKRGHRLKTTFADRQIIQDYALKKAIALKFEVKNYKVSFSYNEDSEAFYWTFLFPQAPNFPGNKRYDTIDINWENIDDIKVGNVTESNSY